MMELQKKVLSLLKLIDQICQDNKIDYYLTAGTLIGALRHKGFIPWDDDADIIMTRDNWEKFLNCTRGNLPENIVLNTQYDDPNLAATANHLVDTSTTSLYRYDVTNPERAGVMVDIIIMDPIPNDEEAKNDYVESLTKFTELTTIPYQYSLRIGKSTDYKDLLKKEKKYGMKRTLDDLTKKAFHYSEEESQLYVQRFAGSPHFWPKELLGTPKYVPFEDTMLPIPEHAEEYTCIGYADDWMNIPSSGPTKSTHEHNVGSLTVPGEIILDDFERRVDRKQINKLYKKRKIIQVSNTERVFNTTINQYKFASERIRLLYKKKSEEINIMSLLEEENYDALDKYFEEYINVQCTNFYIGSSALEGWINWYRKCHPYFIDIGDEALYAVLCLFEHQQKLAWFGKLLKARKSIERPLTDQLKHMDQLYIAVKKTTYAYDSNDNTKCRELVDLFLVQYPNDPFLLKFDLKLKIRSGISETDIINNSDKLLKMIPNDAELMYFKADALIKSEEMEEGITLFNDIVEFSNNGIVLLHMKETVLTMFKQDPSNHSLAELLLKIRKKMGEEDIPNINDIIADIENVPLCNNNSNERIQNYNAVLESDHQTRIVFENDLSNNKVKIKKISNVKKLTEIQEKRYELLCELKNICQTNNIKYYLFGKALLQAARTKQYIDENGDITVAMTPENCKKFMMAVKNENRADRFLDSMYDNPKFHRFCVRYGNNETLDFSTSQCANHNCGIFITIEILRNPANGKYRNLVDQMLEAGWETRNTMKWTSLKRKVSYFTIYILCFFFGEKSISRWLFKRFLKGPSKKKNGKYYIKPFWGKRTYFPTYWFRYTTEITLNGTAFSTIKPYGLYLNQTFGKKWRTMKFPYSKSNKFTRIVDSQISSIDFLNHLNSNDIDCKRIFEYKQKSDRKYALVNSMGSQTSHYWDIMCMCGERYRLYEKYIPQKLYILELFRSGNIRELMTVLGDYYKMAILYSKKGLGLLFDQKIFDIMEYCLKITGKGKNADMLKRLHTVQDKRPIVLPAIKEVSGMREATNQELPAILIYLKRNLDDCIYMYIDISKYGLDNPNMKVWLDSDENGINLVVMNYYSGISIQADDNVLDKAAANIANIIKEENATMVRGKKSIIEKIAPFCSSFKVEYGFVFNLKTFRDDYVNFNIETALPKDVPEIAKLMKEDPEISSYYDEDGLVNQLTERINTEMGRSYILRENGKIIAHIASYAEYEHLATTGGLIVSSNYQNGVYGSAMEGYLINKLIEEGFKVYTFVSKPLRRKLLQLMGNDCVGEYGKLILDTEKR